MKALFFFSHAIRAAFVIAARCRSSPLLRQHALLCRHHVYFILHSTPRRATPSAATVQAGKVENMRSCVKCSRQGA